MLSEREATNWYAFIEIRIFVRKIKFLYSISEHTRSYLFTYRDTYNFIELEILYDVVYFALRVPPMRAYDL